MKKKTILSIILSLVLATGLLAFSACNEEENVPPVASEPVSALTTENLAEYSNFYGRWMYNEDLGAYSFCNSASGFEFRFTGSMCTVDIKCNSISGYNEKEVSVFLDGETDSEVNVATIGRFNARYKMVAVQGLEYKEHTVKILKRQSSMYNTVLLYGAETDGSFLAPPARPSVKLEVFGDSITCGEGTDREESGGQALGGYTARTQNVFHSYAGYCAEKLGAELQVFGRGGICLHITNSSSPLTIYNNYRSVNVDVDVSEDPAYEWDYSLFTPDAVIIYLGTNDYNRGNNNASQGNGYPAYTDGQMKAYMKRFIQEVIGGKYGSDVPIFLLSGMMVPQSNLSTVMEEVKEELAGSYDITAISLSATPYGHPIAREHEAAGNTVAAAIAEKLGLTLE